MPHVRAALQSIDQPAFAADPTGHVCLINDAFSDLFSVDPADDLDKAWQACLGDDGWPRWLQGAQAGEPFNDGLRSVRETGRWVYRASPVLAGGVTGSRWLVTLSRESLGATASVGLVRLSLHAAVRAGRMGLWEWSPHTDDSLWSPELYDVYRLPRGSGVEPGSRFLNMLHPDDLSKVNDAVAAANVKGGIDPFVIRLYVGDGSLRWFLTCAQTEGLPGRPFSRLVGVNIDVTEAVRADEMVQAARLERQRQEEIIDAVMEHAPVGIAVALIGEERLAYVSRFGTDMIGATPEYGHSWSAWQICHHDTQAAAEQEQLPLMRACSGMVIRNEEWLLRALDGSLVPISCNAGPIHDASGSVVGGTVVWHDVTPFKEAQRQRELFLAAVSHELRTPLNAIHSWSEVLRNSSDTTLWARGLESIRRNVQSQARLVEDLLEAARIAAGKLDLDLTPHKLVSIVRSAVDSMSPIADTAQVVLRLTVQEDDLCVAADEVRLRQAVCNLLTNAIKFSGPGGLVDVRLQAAGGTAVLEVADHGIGIDPGQLERVFDQFWQGSGESIRNAGLGLGLSIARHIVLRHGGDLTAHSEGAGLGAIFRMELPVTRLN